MHWTHPLPVLMIVASVISVSFEESTFAAAALNVALVQPRLLTDPLTTAVAAPVFGVKV